MSIDILDHGQQAALAAAAAQSATEAPVAISTSTVEDIDKEGADDPQQCAEYVNDIYTYLREMEVRSATPNPAHLFPARSVTVPRACTSRITRR